MLYQALLFRNSSRCIGGHAHAQKVSEREEWITSGMPMFRIGRIGGRLPGTVNRPEGFDVFVIVVHDQRRTATPYNTSITCVCVLGTAFAVIQ